MKKAILTAGVITALTPVLNSHVVLANNVEELSVQNEYARSTVENMDATGKVNVSSNTVLNIRTQPTTNSSVKGKMKSGSIVKITGRASNGWYRVNYNNIVGYASDKYITLTTNQSQSSNTSSSNKGRVNTTSSNLNIRKSPTTKASVTGKLSPGTVVDIIEKQSSGWYYINNNGKKGYVDGKYITLVSSNSSNTSSSNKGRVNTTSSNLNIRKSPTTKASVTGKLSPGTVVDIIEKQSSGWYYINNNGKKGYVDGKYITLVSSNSSNTTSQNTTNVGKIATVSANALNVRSGAGTNYSVINKLYAGNNVKILSSSSNGWYKVELSSGATGWCDGRYLNNFRNGSLSSSSSNTSSAQTNSKKAQAVINVAKSKLGCKYVWGAEGPNTFDCSGLTMYAYKNGAGINIPRVSRDQARAGRYVAKSELQPGDLVFFDGNYGSSINHVGIYIGNNQMIHAPKPGDVVKVSNIDTNHYKKAYVTARRYV